MKRFRHILSIVSLVFFVLLTTDANAEGIDSTDCDMDNIRVSLLTCGPGNEAYSLFGHTAIRVTQPDNDMDIVVNYGMFSFAQRYFIMRFVLGLTDYRMGVTSFPDFEEEYRYEGRWVMEQSLNLTRKEKVALLMAINENYKPENVTYRYNFFYNNCTTKARDIIACNIEGKIKYLGTGKTFQSFRELCHSKTENSRWSQFGNDLLLGYAADLPTTFEEQQFLPERLMGDFDKAQISDSFGHTRKLVTKESYIIQKSNERTSTSQHPITPRTTCAIVAIVIICISIIEYRKKTIWWVTDAVLMTITGLAGMILFVMIFSKHPTVNVNFQILILNPLSLIMAIPMARKERKMEKSWWNNIYLICLLIGIFLRTFQHYAEGIEILALSLLIRYTAIALTTRNTQRKRIR